jgi:hypothetical protein
MKTVDEFIFEVKEKSGDQMTRDGRLIRDLPDKELLQKLIDRYPGERDNLVDLDSYLSPEELTPEIPKTDVQQRLNTAKKGFFSSVGEKYRAHSQRAGEIQQSDQNFLSKTLQGAGSAAKFIGETALEGVKAVTPDIIEESVSGAIEGAAKPIVESAPVQAGMEEYAQWKEANPEAAANLEAIGSISTLLPIGKAGQVARGTVGQTIDLFTPAQATLEKKVVDIFQKGVKPNLQGQQTLGQADKYKQSVVDAVKTISTNKNDLQFTDEAGDVISGRNPESLQEFSEAIDQTKKKIYEQYDNLATQAGEQGVKVDGIKIANQLDEVINNKALKLSNPEAVRYAEEVRNRFVRAGEIDAKTAQDIIQNYNNSLKAFYRNPTPEGLTKNAVDALMANQMRKALDDGIEGLTGAQYQSLKNQYASLKTIERDVLRATLRDARKNAKGLIDYTDIFSGGQLVSGLLTLNPGAIATGAAQKGISEWFKFLNNPNRAVENMFETAEKLDKPASTVPISTRKQLEAPRQGAADVSNEVPINLPERSQSTIDIQERQNPNIRPSF